MYRYSVPFLDLAKEGGIISHRGNQVEQPTAFSLSVSRGGRARAPCSDLDGEMDIVMRNMLINYSSCAATNNPTRPPVSLALGAHPSWYTHMHKLDRHL